MASSLEIAALDRERIIEGKTLSPRPAYQRAGPVTPESYGRQVGQPLALPYINCTGEPRWKRGERLNHLFESCCQLFAMNVAVFSDDASLTYRQLDDRANQLARYLIRQGIDSGDRVGLLFDKTVETYVALLAVLKVNAAYVALDAGFPTERLRFIAADAGLKAVASMSCFSEKLAAVGTHRIFLDVASASINAESCLPLASGEVRPARDHVCYIIYTSGTTGNPKGVVIEHPSICNFVRVAAELYGFAPGDRVYQGMTIAFDFSVEEIWVPLIAGATLVPGKPGGSLVGNELSAFLRQRRITGLCCCPTLLATIEEELPELRILLVGGEACPQNLVHRWYRPDRRILNSYGPTEATVTATLAELMPNKQVTIGRPLPTYSVIILDPEQDQTVCRNEFGEIGIAGIGLAAGYLNRDELTRQKFIPDFLNLAGNFSKRIYRTGDLGRINDDGEIEYHGRIDTQVKIRGYRIETGEIESVLLELPQIAQAAVATHETEPGMVELVAYYSLKRGERLVRNDIAEVLRSRLPAYMVPAFLEELPFIPMLVSSKADRKKLPKPKGPRCSTGKEVVGAKTAKERVLADALAEVLKVDRVSVEDDFFNDLGAHSLLMARFCAKIRQNAAMSNISMRDIYQNPTIAKLAACLGDATNENIVATKREPFHHPSDFSYYGCGALQLLFYIGYGLFDLWLLAAFLRWTYVAIDHPIELYLRSVLAAIAAFAVLTAVPLAAKWLLVGKWKPELIPIWSLRYFRFWVVKTLIGTAPMAIFRGSPLYNFYLRWLGARVGRNTVIQSRFVPVCTDLFSVGDNTILRKESILLGYRAQSNFIHTGSIEIGSNAFVGEASVIDINIVMGDDTQLGHASSLQSGQRVPAGKHYHGSPAVETESDYCKIEGMNCSLVRRGAYTALQLAALFMVVPIPVMLVDCWYPYFTGFAGSSYVHLEELAFVLLMLGASVTLFFGALLVGLIIVYMLPRLCQLYLKPSQTYVLYGFHYWLQAIISGTSNSRFYNLLFGDSSIIVHYMRFVGWNLNEFEQTGSNFGTNQQHDNPFLCDIGSRTMVSDGLSMINMQMSSTSFQLNTTRIGERNYLGNDIHYPPDGRTGANCLLATKVMIPIEGPVRENIGLLGSPCFEIPRIVARDRDINAALSQEARKLRISRKNSHNFFTAALFLFTRWIAVFAALVSAHLTVLNYGRYGILALLVGGMLYSVAAIAFFAFIERASIRFKRLTPKMVSIYEPYFWAHERHWKLSDSPIIERFGGTPFKNLISRLVGVNIGRKIYDGGCMITERTLTTIGDETNLNEGSILQAHSLEEGVFKSDYVRIGNGVTLGPAAFAHYGVTMNDYAVLDADSFLMKGEVVDAHAIWRGNPAKLFRFNTTKEQAAGDPIMCPLMLPEERLKLNVASIAAE